jgi:biotin carboxyl carrier protein
MPGKVVAVHVSPGDAVEPGAPLVVLEAMKMENEFRATAAGVVAEVRVVPGQAVNAGDLLLVVVA